MKVSILSKIAITLSIESRNPKSSKLLSKTEKPFSQSCGIPKSIKLARNYYLKLKSTSSQSYVIVSCIITLLFLMMECVPPPIVHELFPMTLVDRRLQKLCTSKPLTYYERYLEVHCTISMSVGKQVLELECTAASIVQAKKLCKTKMHYLPRTYGKFTSFASNTYGEEYFNVEQK